MEVLISSFTQGAVWAIMAVGLYITYRLLGIADLSAEGTFTLGAAISAMAISNGLGPIAATLLGWLGGAVAGWVAGFIHTKMKIPALITGILMQTGLYSINLRVMGSRPNIALLGTDVIYTKLEGFLSDKLSGSLSATVIKNLSVAGVSVLVFALIVFLLVKFLNTEIGLALRATGDNKRMSEANGINTNAMTTLGYMLANSFIALCGAMVAQKDGFADIGMGTGQIVVGLSAIVIAEIVIPNLTIGKRLTTLLFGSFVYRLIIDLILNQNFVQIHPSDLRLFSAILLGLVLFYPEIKRRRSKSKAKGGQVKTNG